MPDQTFGDTNGGRVLLQNVDAQFEFAQAGTLEGWQDGVALPAIGNRRLVLALCVAFAGPLLDLVEAESGGFHFAGGSSGGKTTALHCAASVWGCPVHSWRTSDNAAEALARGASDTLLCMDEISEVDPRAADALAYMLGKAHMRRDATARPVITWRVMFLSTGEVGLAEKMGEAGRRARAGQSVRMIEVPADAGAGHQLFENLHGFSDGAAFADHLRLEAKTHYGHAGRAFLAQITQDIEDLGRVLRGAQQRWLAANCPPHADGQVKRAAGRFALLAAAGELPATLGIFPWPDGEAERAAVTCFRAWLARRGGIGPTELAAGIAQVRHFLEAHGSSRFETKNADGGEGEQRVNNRAGFRVRNKKGRWDYLIPLSRQSDFP